MKRLSTVLILFLAITTGSAFAAPPWSGGGPRPVAERAGAGMSLDRAVEQVRRETGGRILQAETVRENGAAVHRIKVLTPDGRVRVVRMPAR